MNTVLWGLQGLLAVAFFVFGGMHLGMSYEAMAAKMAWVADSPAWLPRFIGAMEVLGAIGLVAPSVTRFAPWLTPLAAGLLALMMVLAAGMHVVRGEFGNGVPSVVLLLLCGFVAFGRMSRAPIPERTAAVSESALSPR